MPSLTNTQLAILTAAAQRAGGASKPRRPKAHKPARKTKTLRRASASTRPGTKQSLLVDLLSWQQGATITEAVEATRWQPHSVRGAISGALRRKLGLAVSSGKVNGRGRVYRIAGRG